MLLQYYGLRLANLVQFMTDSVCYKKVGFIDLEPITLQQEDS